MMVRSVAFFCFVLVQCFIQKVSYCQETAVSADEGKALKNARSVYERSLGEQSGIYRGPGYIGYPYPTTNGHPFFETPDQTIGTIYYDGMLYKDIPIWYDLVKDQVIVLHTDGLSKISLHNEKIDYFSLYNHLFIHIKKDTSNTSFLSAGFYDRVYQGKTEVLVKRSKGSLKDATTQGIFIKILKQKNDFYIKKGEKYYPVESAGSVLKALGSKQKEIQEFLKKSNIKFRKDPENTIIRMVRYYDQLTELK